MLVKKNRLKKILKPFKDQTDKLTIPKCFVSSMLI